MKGQSKAKTPKEYIAELDEPRKSDLAELKALVKETAATSFGL